jgi:hypothetical protein
MESICGWMYHHHPAITPVIHLLTTDYPQVIHSCGQQSTGLADRKLSQAARGETGTWNYGSVSY